MSPRVDLQARSTWPLSGVALGGAAHRLGRPLQLPEREAGGKRLPLELRLSKYVWSW